jgi:hypothetical protein
MTDSLRTRIEYALFDACCRFNVPDSERRDMADAVINAVEADYILVPKSHTLAKAAKEWLENDE